jgi:hypothetical protein
LPCDASKPAHPHSVNLFHHPNPRNVLQISGLPLSRKPYEITVGLSGSLFSNS